MELLSRPEHVRSVSRDELERRIELAERVVLVEALAPEQFREAHLPGALNLVPWRVNELAPKLLPDKHAEIVVYCSSQLCDSSRSVAQLLLHLGYSNVAHYPGGKAEWISAGLPVERGDGR